MLIHFDFPDNPKLVNISNFDIVEGGIDIDTDTYAILGTKITLSGFETIVLYDLSAQFVEAGEQLRLNEKLDIIRSKALQIIIANIVMHIMNMPGGYVLINADTIIDALNKAHAGIYYRQ